MNSQLLGRKKSSPRTGHDQEAMYKIRLGCYMFEWMLEHIVPYFETIGFK